MLINSADLRDIVPPGFTRNADTEYGVAGVKRVGPITLNFRNVELKDQFLKMMWDNWTRNRSRSNFRTARTGSSRASSRTLFRKPSIPGNSICPSAFGRRARSR